MNKILIVYVPEAIKIDAASKSILVVVVYINDPVSS